VWVLWNKLNFKNILHNFIQSKVFDEMQSDESKVIDEMNICKSVSLKVIILTCENITL